MVERLHQEVYVLTLMGAFELMAAAHLVFPLGLLHVHHLQRWFASLRLGGTKRRLATIPHS